ncbi:MAG: hypothetical protein GVY31_06020 [Alphaproteobacteria bacterium]|jgi:hypothetical protein|nr:hypothetical protein [Alphaproteobacteria bacterium]
MGATAFKPLPLGADRRAGIEIEFGGLTEAQAARIARDLLGGEIDQTDDHDLRLSGSALGDLKIYLDTALRDRIDGPLAEIGLDLSRAVVPVEIVTPPLDFDQLPDVDRLCAALRAAGAIGTRDGILLGFGLHLNPEIPGETVDDLLPTLTAYALLEDRLRFDGGMDVSRRLLPFSDPFPRAFVDALAAAEGWRMTDLFDAHLSHNPTRNRGLDVLPILAELDSGRVERALDGLGAVSARPAWHYRLPDCRIDEADWSVSQEWNRWALVELVAADGKILDGLKAAWRDHRAALTTLRPDWRAEVDDRLNRAGLA